MISSAANSTPVQRWSRRASCALVEPDCSPLSVLVTLGSIEETAGE